MPSPERPASHCPQGCTAPEQELKWHCPEGGSGFAAGTTWSPQQDPSTSLQGVHRTWRAGIRASQSSRQTLQSGDLACSGFWLAQTSPKDPRPFPRQYQCTSKEPSPALPYSWASPGSPYPAGLPPVQCRQETPLHQSPCHCQLTISIQEFLLLLLADLQTRRELAPGRDNGVESHGGLARGRDDARGATGNQGLQHTGQALTTEQPHPYCCFSR